MTVRGTPDPLAPDTVDAPVRAAFREYLTEFAPALTAREQDDFAVAWVEQWLEKTRAQYYSDGLVDQAAEDALVASWRNPTTATARSQILAFRQHVAIARRGERRSLPAETYAPLPALARFGPYVADVVVGVGHDGTAIRAVHQTTGLIVTIKLLPRGDVWLLHHLGDTWPPFIVRSIDAGPPDDACSVPWLAREYADEALVDVFRRRKGRPLPRADALLIFAACCNAVAWLHQHHVYRWSAHRGNVFRIGERWAIGDFARCLIYVDRADSRLDGSRQLIFDSLGADTPATRTIADWAVTYWSWGHPTSAGLTIRNPERENRHRIDDCSGLAGLLCDLLSGQRWDAFFRAVNREPFCSGSYPVTGVKRIDAPLSRILNQAWRGDEGGAPLLANGNRGEKSTYDDPRALLADVESVLG